MHRLALWPCRFAVLGTLALAGGLLAAACGDEATAEPEDPWAAATVRVEAATFLVFKDLDHRRVGYEATASVAFYIGNDEWITADERITVGSFGLYAIRQGESYGSHLLDDLRPVRVIGYDSATGIGLLAAPGDGVPPLRMTAAIPPPCTPVRLAGYWYGWSEERAIRLTTLAERRAALAARHFPDLAVCDPTVPPPAGRAFGGNGSKRLDSYMEFAPGTAGAAVGGVVTEAGVPLLLLHPSRDWETRAYDLGAWSGAPLVNAAGDVVGVRPGRFWYYQSLTGPAVIEALDRIRRRFDNGPPPP